MTKSSAAPASVPVTDPTPPASSVPPMTTAAIARSSNASPIRASWPPPDNAVVKIPAIPAHSPVMTQPSVVVDRQPHQFRDRAVAPDRLHRLAEGRPVEQPPPDRGHDQRCRGSR